MITRLSVCLLFCSSITFAQTRYYISTIAGSDTLVDGGPATKALLWGPADVAADAQGNVYIADTNNNRVRKVSASGTISTFACSGQPGYSGDGGQAVDAKCSAPAGIAVDSSGVVYFSDTGNGYIRRVGLDGRISNFAGVGTSFSSSIGDGGPATSAFLATPSGLAFDASGTLYVADRSNHRIRAIGPNGIITTVAGSGSYCSFFGDTGPANQARLCSPRAVTVDLLGRILIADSGNHRVRRFQPGGLITTLAGIGDTTSPLGDGSLATAASINTPGGVATDPQGNVYISDNGNQRIRMVGSDGKISTLAGTSVGFAGDGTAALNAMLNAPQGIAFDSRGNLYIADSGNSRIRMVNATRLITTFAGMGHYSGDDGPATSASLTNPNFLALDKAGNLFVADQDDHVIRKIDTTGKITTVAGTGAAGSQGDGGPAIVAQLNSPQGLAFDAAGNLYVADAGNNTVRMISPGGTIVRIAGGGASLGDGGPALKATLNSPHGLVIDAAGVLYIADTTNNRIRKVLPDGTIVSLIGGSTSGGNGDGGLAAAASTYRPFDIKLAPDGTIYFSEGSGTLRYISPAGIINTNGYFSGNSGIAVDASGNLFFTYGNQIYQQLPSNFRVTIAGQSQAGFGGDGGPALQAVMNSPLGMVVDSKGNLYVCDQRNNRIRKLTSDTVSQLVTVSGDQQTGNISTALAAPLIVQVSGANGQPFPGVSVAFTSTGSGARLSSSSTVTSADGRAGITLTLPSTPGTFTVTATVAGITPVTFTFTAVDPPATLSILSGDNQFGPIHSTLPQVVAISVTDNVRRAIPGVPVTFTVTAGFATVNPKTMETGSDGAAYTVVTFGDSGGLVTVSATVTGLPPATFSLYALAPDSPQIFNGGLVSAGLSTPAVIAAAPNAIVSIFGRNFAPAGTFRQVTGDDLVNGRLPTRLADVCVRFGTVLAPIFLVTPTQLNVQVPVNAAANTVNVQVALDCGGPAETVTNSLRVSVANTAPEFFYASTGSVKNPVAIPAPAQPGQLITLYATGLGLSTPAFAPGELPPAGAPVAGIGLRIDGVPVDTASIQYAGIAPMNAGLYQINLVVPLGLSAGDHDIALLAGGRTSPTAILPIAGSR